ncbi:gamma-butyrobetaine dioxygenase [Marinobacter daepoensis]|uniref:trimethyllysine dioxygenase n=1 Tax=Marinobacter daepoensis TaxID=262077 RepID=A0ABS3B948_9GAMM|nr:gamma-butyrobetaine dioxygenase [Marinobacter daepoensis]MBN7768338.1 gamma-butyrobetaine dioxygenase [Marinobacter daepoensis]MBY6080639.1 gamma-butyrobetaine dioxygenase [Marinobacter daepoensis]
MLGLSNVKMLAEGKVVQVEWADGVRARFHAIWLRDNSPDSETLSPGNGQRLVRIQDVPEEVGVKAATVVDDARLEIAFLPENKVVVFDAAWLRLHRYDRPSNAAKAAGWTNETIVRWGKELEEKLPVASFRGASENPGELRGWLADIRRYGVAKMTDMPVESGAICRVVELFGFIRETNYGRFFEVRTEVNPVNLAYTGLGLQVHTDNPYRDPVPTLQLLSCLENSVEGGDSVVVDSFKAVEILREEAPDAFQALSSLPANYTYTGTGDVMLKSKRPMIELGPDGELLTVRFNNRSLGPVTDISFEQMETFYDGYRKLADIMERPELAVTFKLQPGELFIVDNTRVTHGRVGYEGSGSRWLQGAYADLDGLRSTLAVLEQKGECHVV